MFAPVAQVRSDEMREFAQATFCFHAKGYESARGASDLDDDEDDRESVANNSSAEYKAYLA